MLEVTGIALHAADFGDYRYGFNGKENDQDWGKLIQDYGFRLYNPAIAKFLSVDPLAPEYPELTPYQFASNTPIEAVDWDGLEARFDLDQDRWTRRLAKGKITKKQFLDNHFYTGAGGVIGSIMLADHSFTGGVITRTFIPTSITRAGIMRGLFLLGADASVQYGVNRYYKGMNHRTSQKNLDNFNIGMNLLFAQKGSFAFKLMTGVILPSAIDISQENTSIFTGGLADFNNSDIKEKSPWDFGIESVIGGLSVSLGNGMSETIPKPWVKSVFGSSSTNVAATAVGSYGKLATIPAKAVIKGSHPNKKSDNRKMTVLELEMFKHRLQLLKDNLDRSIKSRKKIIK